MADVMPYLYDDVMPWLMLLPFMLWQMVNHRGRCYCLYFIQMADVIAILFMLHVVGH